MKAFKILLCLSLVLCSRVSDGRVVDRKFLARSLINYVIFGETVESRNVIEDLNSLPAITVPEFVDELTKPVQASNYVHYELLPNHQRAKDLAKPLTDPFFLRRDYRHFNSYSFDNGVANNLLGNAIVLLTLQKSLVERKGLTILGVQNIRNLNLAYEGLILNFVQSADAIFKQIAVNGGASETVNNFLFSLSLLDIETSSRNLSDSLYEYLDQVSDLLNAKLNKSKTNVCGSLYR